MSPVGLKEIADEIGVKKQVVSNWRVRYDDFPKPVIELAMGPIWDLQDIISWFKRYRMRKALKCRYK